MRKLISLMFLIVLVAGLCAADISTQELILETIVPENYGIHIPDDALKLDQFLFEFDAGDGISELLTDSRFSVGSFEDLDMQSFTLIYYGNQSGSYSVPVRVDSTGFENGQASSTIPVNISFSEPEEKPEDITIVDDEEYGSCSIFIPPSGPRRGVEVVNLNIGWDSQRDILPGRYEMTLNIELLSNA